RHAQRAAQPKDLGPITTGASDRLAPRFRRMPTALITGASRGLGRALARSLIRDDWKLVIDARGGADLEAVARELGQLGDVTALPGDISDPLHRRALVDAAGGRIDLLVNNASTL